MAAFFGKKVLREVEEDQLFANLGAVRAKLGDRACLRAIHFFAECRRAAALYKDVAEDRFDDFLFDIIQGGHSSFEYNQNAYSIHAPQQQGTLLVGAVFPQSFNHGAQTAPAHREGKGQLIAVAELGYHPVSQTGHKMAVVSVPEIDGTEVIAGAGTILTHHQLVHPCFVFKAKGFKFQHNQYVRLQTALISFLSSRRSIKASGLLSTSLSRAEG